MELKKKEAETKRLKHPQSLFRKNLQLKDVCHSTLKATKILGQRKYSIGRELQSLVVRGKKLLTWTFLQHVQMVTEKACNLLE